MGPEVSRHCLTGEEKPRKKTSPRKLFPIGDRTRVRLVTVVHATACPRAVDTFLSKYRKPIFGRLVLLSDLQHCYIKFF